MFYTKKSIDNVKSRWKRELDYNHIGDRGDYTTDSFN